MTSQYSLSVFRRYLGLIVLLPMLPILITCSGQNSAQRAADEQAWLQDGVIIIARPAPGVTEVSQQKLLAFLPGDSLHAGKWLRVDKVAKTVNLMEDDEILATSSGVGIENLQPGRYEVLHKQRNAPWHASDSYFSSRKLPLPGQGEKARFLRGALGEFAVFLSEDTPLHNGPVWSTDIGGVKLKEGDISRIYYHLEVGSMVEVR
ncbi:L,D-transpeptidase [Oligoflexia bacterium]|nr:L,D-transpeptidase [Oligoflexia bacterium]